MKSTQELLINNCHTRYRGLAIEFNNVDGSSYPSVSQREMLDRYQMTAYLAVVCHNFENTLDLLNDYLKGVRYLCCECATGDRYKNMEDLNNHNRNVHNNL